MFGRQLLMFNSADLECLQVGQSKQMALDLDTVARGQELLLLLLLLKCHLLSGSKGQIPVARKAMKVVGIVSVFWKALLTNFAIWNWVIILPECILNHFYAASK